MQIRTIQIRTKQGITVYVDISLKLKKVVKYTYCTLD